MKDKIHACTLQYGYKYKCPLHVIRPEQRIIILLLGIVTFSWGGSQGWEKGVLV